MKGYAQTVSTIVEPREDGTSVVYVASPFTIEEWVVLEDGSRILVGEVWV